jgi:crotonobetainyl-CoA:carnitine CoA-transferase CaiB-like acyl-CoA transferase
MSMAYEGIRIIDFTQMEQGAVGAQVLADFGAEVIKVERIETGDVMRGNRPIVNGLSSFFAACNRNKKSLSIDLKTSEGKEIIYKLVKISDVVASNFRPGVMERLGFGWEDLSRINPRNICAYASGYGQTGPYRDRRGQDLIAQAMGGLMALTGERDGPLAAAGPFVTAFLEKRPPRF